MNSVRSVEKLGLILSQEHIENENDNENEMSKILKKNYDKLRYQLKTLGLNLENIHEPEAPELTNDKHVDHAYDCACSF
jgi:hypothetical protein